MSFLHAITVTAVVVIRNQEKHQTAYAEFYIAYTSFNKEEFREAIRHYDSAIRLNPFMTAYTNRGAAKFRLNCFKAAISDCNVAIGYDSSDAIAYYYRGLARKSLEDRNGAVEDLGRAKVLAQEQRQEDVLLAINEELSDFNHSGSKKQ